MAEHGDQSDVGRLLTMQEVTRDLGVTRRTIERWIRAGRFPRRIALSGNAVRFSEPEVAEWKRTMSEQRH